MSYVNPLRSCCLAFNDRATQGVCAEDGSNPDITDYSELNISCCLKLWYETLTPTPAWTTGAQAARPRDQMPLKHQVACWVDRMAIRFWNDSLFVVLELMNQKLNQGKPGIN